MKICIIVYFVQVIIGAYHAEFMTDEDKKNGAIISGVANFTNHEKWFVPDQGIGEGYDITLIELDQDIDLTRHTPACMALSSDTFTFDKEMAWAFGKNIFTLYKVFDT